MTSEEKEEFGQRLFTSIALTKEHIRKDYHFTPKYCPYDVVMKSGNTFFVNELKVRQNRTIEEQLKDGSMLEHLKLYGILTRLKEEITKSNTKLEFKKLYFEFLSDGVLIYDLKEISDYVWQKWILRKDNQSNSNTTKPKSVTFLFDPIEIIYY